MVGVVSWVDEFKSWMVVGVGAEFVAEILISPPLTIHSGTITSSLHCSFFAYQFFFFFFFKQNML